MKVFVPREPSTSETRVALDPLAVARLVKLGLEVQCEAGLGDRCGFTADDFKEAGATETEFRLAALGEADLVLRIHRPPDDEIPAMKKGAVHLSFLDPFNEGELLGQLAAAGLTAVSLEMIPRTTLAQKMDALSSQASLAGYAAVLRAGDRLGTILPMMMTPAGTLSPARVFVIGVGVAGLQAIATAKRLGARVEAFDTRPDVADQIRSLGAKPVEVDLGETSQTGQGYATKLTDEQLELQRKAMARVCAHSDIVITTAKLFGRPAPLIVTEEILGSMKRGSIVVDLAADTGGNVAGSVPGEETLTPNGVLIIGASGLEGTVAKHASQMFGANLANWIEHFWDPETKQLKLDFDDEILAGCVLTHDGAIVHPQFKPATPTD